jgi:hypothetical protein
MNIKIIPVFLGMLCCVSCSKNNAAKNESNYVVSTFVGSKISTSNVNGFTGSGGICIDAGGNLYSSDIHGSWKITPDTVVTLVVSLLEYEQSFPPNLPFQWGGAGLIINGQGNFYSVAPSLNMIFKATLISTTTYGILYPFAGGGANGFVDGGGDSAEFSLPTSSTFDAQGNMYVLDQQGAAIRKVTPAGQVSTFVTTNSFTDIFSSKSLMAIVCDPAGNIYASDADDHKIWKVTPSGQVSTFATNIGDGPEALTIDGSGNLFTVDGYVVWKISPGGSVSEVAGTDGTTGYKNGPGNSATFGYLGSIAVDASGTIYVGDGGNNVIRKIVPAQ